MRVVKYDTTWSDYPDDESIAIIVYFAGCESACNGCHNYELQSPEAGEETSVDELCVSLKELGRKNRTNKVVFSGGDPLYKGNVQGVSEFLKLHGDEFDVCIYTGFKIEFVNVDGAAFYKCGMFDANLLSDFIGKDEEKMVFASTNQKLYNSKKELVSKGNEYYWGTHFGI